MTIDAKQLVSDIAGITRARHTPDLNGACSFCLPDRLVPWPCEPRQRADRLVRIESMNTTLPIDVSFA